MVCSLEVALYFKRMNILRRNVSTTCITSTTVAWRKWIHFGLACRPCTIGVKLDPNMYSVQQQISAKFHPDRSAFEKMASRIPVLRINRGQPCLCPNCQHAKFGGDRMSHAGDIGESLSFACLLVTGHCRCALESIFFSVIILGKRDLSRHTTKPIIIIIFRIHEILSFFISR